MAGILQEGLHFASIPVTIFDNDARIDRLLDAQGWRGVGVYMYLLLRAYGGRGYYTEWCFADCATTARKMGGGVSAKNVEEAMRCCTQVGLWDKRLLEEWGILTSIDVQQNYLIAAKKARRKVRIVSEYWLLEEKPPLNSLVSCTKNENECNKNADKCSKDENECNKDDPSMVCIYDMYSTTTTTTSSMLEGERQNTGSLLSSAPLTDEEMEELQRKYGDSIGQWENVLGRPLTPFELEDVCALVNEYGGQWVIDAMRVAGEAGKSSLRFVKGVLNNWKTDGRKAKKPAQSDVNVYGKAEQILAERRAKRAAEKGSV